MATKKSKPNIYKKKALVTKKKFSPGLKTKPKFSVVVLFFLVVALAIPGIYLIYNSMAAAPSEVTVGPCTVKSKVPKLNSITVTTANFCKNTLPKIGNILKDKNSNAKIETSCKKINITIESSLGGNTGYARPVLCQIKLDGGLIKQNNSDPFYWKSLLAHEMTHLATSRQDVAHFTFTNSWLEEGLSEYVRFKLGYNTYWKADCKQYNHYRKGYGCAAAFLRFTEKYLWNNVAFESAKAVKNTNVRTSFDSITQEDKFFKSKIGATTETIYQECRAGGPKGNLTKFCKDGLKTYIK